MTDASRTGGVSENTSIEESYAEFGDRADYPTCRATWRAGWTPEQLRDMAICTARLAIDLASDQVALLEAAMAEHIARRTSQQQNPNAMYVRGWERRIANHRVTIAKNEKRLVELGVKEAA